MKKIQLTCAHAIVKYLISQKILVDGKKLPLFAGAFGKDPKFFGFYRAMQSYEKALIGGDTSLILSPDSDFFKFFGKTGVIKKQ